MGRKRKIPLKEKIEDFLHSETVPATATKLLLASLALGGIAFTGAVLPVIFKMIEGLRDHQGNSAKYSKRKVANALSTLKRRKLIKITKEKNGKFSLKLTNQGRKRLVKMSLESVSIQKPKKWDGKWRIVFFDIPVEFNAAREALRYKMKELGFKQFQKSVWIIPYECEDEILFISEIFGVEKYVEIITAEKILHEENIRKTFNI
jgi:hypothetical protein